MNSIIVELLSIMPASVWYPLVIGVCVLLVVVGCVPEAGDRIVRFVQKIIRLWRGKRGW